MADALSRKVELAALSRPEGILLDLIKEGLKHDKVAQASVKASGEGRTKVFQVKIIYYTTRKTNDYMSQTRLI